MRTKSWMLLFLYTVWISSLSSCQLVSQPKQVDAKDQMFFDEILQTSDVNNSMRLELMDYVPVPKIDDAIHLSVTNYSRAIIGSKRFDWGLRIFYFDEMSQSWFELENKVEFVPPDAERLIWPEWRKLPISDAVAIWPKLEKTYRTMEVRAMVVGYIYKNDTPTDRKVGAYMDILWEP